MQEADKGRGVIAVSVPPALLQELREIAGDRMRRGLPGGMSATVRELLRLGMERRRNRAVVPTPR